MGGLGNQMFQYAFARSYSLLNNENILLDISRLGKKRVFKNETIREFDLSVFEIKLRPTNSSGYQGLVSLIQERLFPKKVLKEKVFSFDESYLSKQDWNAAYGYFQSEKYFLPIRETLLSDFKLKIDLSDYTKSLVDKIKARECISIHIRRGDYLNNKNINYHGVCTLDYYYESLEYLKSFCNDALVLIFSDDLTWVKENLKLKNDTIFVDGNSGKDSFQDMYLMSLCHHNIIANSSFSWWGAWLNQNEKKKVVAPQNWFATNAHSLEDLLPETWKRI